MKGRYFINEVVLKESGNGKWKLQIKDAEWLDLTTAEVKSLFWDIAQTHREWHLDLMEGSEMKYEYYTDEVVLKNTGGGTWKLCIKDSEWLDLSTTEVRNLFRDVAYIHRELHLDLLEHKE